MLTCIMYGEECFFSDCLFLKSVLICASFLTLVYFGSLAAVHGLVPACPSRVSASSPTSLHMFFLAQVCKPCLASASQLFRLCVRERSRCCRLKLWKTASSDCQSDSLYNPHASFLIQRLSLTATGQHDLDSVSVVAGRVSSESQVPIRIRCHEPPVKTPSSSSSVFCASPSDCARS